LDFTHQTHRIYQYSSGGNKNNTLVSESDVFSPLTSAVPLTDTLNQKYTTHENPVKSPVDSIMS